ncbi:MAG: Wadjet anti-phage system protein JetA family protein [Burkholderiales bacterium]|jgi:hypothetical protein|nr:hypothetical protein [Rhodocyclaceae bacterium]MCA3021307.1 hypothetical protein [Rhodocyclaceae bacterium]MCA3042374.1 hypothetical protein [Rhodocyclaceae bacterium]MCA3054370.1 hypothetical protein [Rhodocyclaceae bacterium]
MNLFDRIPNGLFGALTGRNSRRAWDLLVRLFDRYFGPDSVPPFADGYLHEQVVKEIERFLLDAGWEDESEEGSPNVATPLVNQANQLLARLVETGWLTEEKVGLRRFVSMRPVVARFFDTVQQFVTEGPQLFGGNVLLVYNQLKSVSKDPRGQAGGFVSAAQLCVRLINSLNTTTLRVRDLMKELTQENDTPVFVRRFFSEHISELYVRDFKQLRTENHPLRLRYEIIELVNAVSIDGPDRIALLQGYAELPGNCPGEEEELLERDVQRFRRLLDVEKFLERMDRVMDAATRRAVAYLGYRLKASERIEEVLADSVHAVLKAESQAHPIEARLLTPTALIGDNRLRLPVEIPSSPKRTALQKREMTPNEKAIHLLRKAMIENRDTTPAAVRRYISKFLSPGHTAPAELLPVGTVSDAVSFLVLMRLAGMSSRNRGAIQRNPLLRRLGFDMAMKPGSRVDSQFFNVPNFEVTWREPDAT